MRARGADVLRAAVGGEGCIDALVSLLNSSHEKARRYASVALQYLARNGTSFSPLLCLFRSC
jgi:hypothetical protein